MFLCAFAWSKGGDVVNSSVFVCFCMAEGRTCRKVSCFCVFLLGRRGEMSNNLMFLWVFLGKVEKCRVFACFWFLCVFVWGKGEMSKSVVFVESVVFLCVFWVKSAAGTPDPSAQPII